MTSKLDLDKSRATLKFLYSTKKKSTVGGPGTEVTMGVTMIWFSHLVAPLLIKDAHSLAMVPPVGQQPSPTTS